LKELKSIISGHLGNEMNFVTQTTILGLFDFRAFLNIAMLIIESERARLLRRAILDIVIDTIKHHWRPEESLTGRINAFFQANLLNILD